MTHHDGHEARSPSRRRFLTGTTATGVGLALTSVSAPYAIAAPDPDIDYAALRERWQQIILGPAFDPTDPLFASGVAAIDARAEEVLNLVVDGPERSQVFSDLPFMDGSSADLNSTYSRLRDLAVAHVTPGAARHGDDALVDVVLAGLETAYSLAYNENALTFDAWFYWEIGIPLHLLDINIFLYDHIPAEARERYILALDHFNGDPGLVYEVQNVDFPDRETKESTGSNRVLMCRNVVTRGILGENPDKISLALDRLSPGLAYAKLDLGLGEINDGFYPDGSFIHHRTTPSSGSYGSDLLASVSKILGVLGDSPWATDVANVQVIHDAVDRTFAPIIYHGHRMESVIGRAVTRRRESVPATSIIIAILELAAGQAPEVAARWRAMCKGWLLRHPAYPGYLDGLPIALMALMRDVLDDDSLPEAPEPMELRHFPRMGRTILRGDGWAYAIAMSSERVKHYAHQVVENWHGFHTSSGMTYLYTADAPDLFTGEYWPTADVYGHPGTTIDTRPLPDRAGPAVTTNTWSGGAVLDRRIGAIGQDLRGLASAMTAHKSWFCLPDRIIALGADITDTADPADAHPVITTMEHRLMGPTQEPVLTIDGDVQTTDLGWEASVSNASWAHLAGTAGWVVLDGSPDLQASYRARSGRWTDVGEAGPDTEISRNYVSLRFDHGTNPVGAGYAYVVLPTATAAETAVVAANPGIEVTANSATVQAVTDPSAGVMMANFFEAGNTSRVVADGPCSVVVEEATDTVTVAVADPTHRRDSVEVTVMAGTWRSVQADATVEVIPVRPRHDLENPEQGRGRPEFHSRAALITVDTSARDGVTHTITLAR